MRVLGLFSKRKRDVAPEGTFDLPLPPAPAPPGFNPSPSVAQDIKREIETASDKDMPELPDIPDLPPIGMPEVLAPKPQAPVMKRPEPVADPAPIPQKPAMLPKPIQPSPPRQIPEIRAPIPDSTEEDEDVSLPDFTPEDLEQAEDLPPQEPLRMEGALYVETDAYRNVMRTMHDLRDDMRMAFSHADKLSAVHDRETKGLSAWRLALERVQDALMKTDTRLFER